MIIGIQLQGDRIRCPQNQFPTNEVVIFILIP